MPTRQDGGGKLTLARAAREAVVSLWGMMDYAKTEKIIAQYDLEDFERDLKTIVAGERGGRETAWTPPQQYDSFLNFVEHRIPSAHPLSYEGSARPPMGCLLAQSIHYVAALREGLRRGMIRRYRRG